MCIRDRTCLLLSRWSKVIVCEYGPERAIHAVVVECVVSKPALDCCLCAESAEVRVRFRFRASVRAVTSITRFETDAAILFANRLDSFADFVRTEGAVFIV